MNRNVLHSMFSMALVAASIATAEVQPIQDRTVLPIPEPQHPHSTVLDARNATPPPRFDVKAPGGAPNVLIVLLDDFGFGQSSAFGGPIDMPTVEQLARNGLRYTQFHTTAMCAPTRMALMTGRNHHMANMGSITETATAFPGNTGQRPESIAPLVYGFMGGETNQWAPMIYDGLQKIEAPASPGYHFMTDMTNQAIKWMRHQKSLTPGKPFFIYFAPGATHAPHHAPKKWIAKYSGRFDQGWDRLRDQTLARQKKLGVVPVNTKLAPKPEAIRDWETLTRDEKRLFARQMEVFAGYAEYADAEIGRLIRAIEEQGQLDNTLIIYIVGDNGASAEGGMNGLFNEMTYVNGVQEKTEDILKVYDKLGGPMTYRSPGPKWSHRTTAALATGWSSTGREGWRQRGSCARSGTTSSTSLPRSWKQQACRSRMW
ncbi:MAG: sulfatase [Proteobacteria bacterium]|nr:sulfatase [Pseudomonadota bacterium]